jgi:hypothetical protein
LKRLLVLLAALMMLLALAAPASAITDGELDGNGHPDVVLILMEVAGQPAYRCSGTLIAPTYVLTAGHCAGAPGEFSGIRIFTESAVDGGNNNYPYAGPNSVEAVRWAAHPLYPTAPFFVHDVGMIELATPIVLSQYGELPAVDSLDAFRSGRGHKGQWFTAVGYGVQQAFPDAASWKEQADRVRYVSYPELIQINTPGLTGDFSMLLSNNPTTGGTCFGDSGGPNFLQDTNIVAGVTSFGTNWTCGGTGGVFRTDRQDVQDFIHDFMNP